MKEPDDLPQSLFGGTAEGGETSPDRYGAGGFCCWTESRPHGAYVVKCRRASGQDECDKSKKEFFTANLPVKAEEVPR